LTTGSGDFELPHADTPEIKQIVMSKYFMPLLLRWFPPTRCEGGALGRGLFFLVGLFMCIAICKRPQVLGLAEHDRARSATRRGSWTGEPPPSD
jgi:hypothetical protein